MEQQLLIAFDLANRPKDMASFYYVLGHVMAEFGDDSDAVGVLFCCYLNARSKDPTGCNPQVLLEQLQAELRNHGQRRAPARTPLSLAIGQSRS